MCSIVEYYGVFGKSSCGYCKGKKSSESAGMTAHFLSVEDYQDLIDRGWRRSGKYCYKPSNKTTCCPSYTIKCELDDFVLSRSHKKILKTVNKFLKDGIKVKVCSTGDQQDEGDHATTPETGAVAVEKEYLRSANRDLKQVKMDIQKDSELASKSNEGTDKTTAAASTGTTDNKDDAVANKIDHGNPKKKKQMRLERRQAKLVAKGVPVEDQQPCPSETNRKSLEAYLKEEPTDGKHKLKVILVPSNSAAAKASFDLYKSYQMAVHHDPATKLKPESFERFLCTSPLQVQLVLSSTKEFKSKHGQNEFELYRKYQLVVHNDKVGGINEFYNFLVDSPLKPEDTQTEHTLGSFHQQYWLDDKLIAVAVIDILPHCISSVYFFYDPDYGFLSLGTYSSLRELAYAQTLQRDLPELRYYYMGFYIHSCPKMRYKAKLTASYLLCPEVYTWHKIDEALMRLLDESKYARFNEDLTAQDEDDVTQEDLKRITMYNNGQPIPLEQYLRKCKDSTIFVRAHQYAKYVGRKCARRIVLYL